MAKNKKLSKDEQEKVDMEKNFDKQQTTAVNPSTGAAIEMSPLDSGQGRRGFLRNLLRAPKFGDPAKDRIANLQYNILIGMVLTGILGISVSLAFWTGTSINGFGILIFELLLSIFAFYWQRRGYLELTSWILVGTLYVIFILGLSLSGFTFPIALVLTIVISLAGLLFRYYSVIAITVFTIITLWVLPYIISIPVQIKPNDLGYVSVILVLEGVLLTVASRTLEKSFSEIDRSTQDLLHANKDLQVFNKNLEQRVAERTAKMERRNLDLALATEVSQTVSQVRELNDMLSDAAEIIRAFFGLYYVQVYLVNSNQTELVLQFGTGEVGKELMQRKHRLPLNDSSINGRAAVTKRSVVISDTSTSSIYKPNPLLPNTRSEVAVPLLIGEKLIGVLDVQSEKPGVLNEDALLAFEPMSGQMAVAIQNARLIAEAEKARTEVEALARRLTHEGWENYLDSIHKPEFIGFTFANEQVVPIDNTEEAGSIITSEQPLTAPISVTGEQFGTLVVEMNKETQSARTTELVNAVARQVSQQIESLRLLDSAERYRAEAERASRRITLEGWKEYTDTNASKGLSYIYDLNEVRPHDANMDQQVLESAQSLPLKINEETIGRLVVQGLKEDDSEALDFASAVVERLSAHIENLRLSEQSLDRARRERALRQITSAVRGSTDPATILRSAARELGTLLGRKTIVRLATNDGQSSEAQPSTDLATETISNNGHEPVSPAESPNTDGGDK